MLEGALEIFFSQKILCRVDMYFFFDILIFVQNNQGSQVELFNYKLKHTRLVGEKIA